ncbi:hypothetical protein G7085_05320 [Tessaracoccus sp. HDW20]|uniref:hypothetical protein n=1 Tax=Tessaracoccus coleopterorum TaxID=2714950 RepID=UPI0018D3A14E|nr:hypothetical protein [Tessaracoccus coleopterorum]NHB84238.1 hypothetical protein [Tessaracoccus coleopterorum]
MLGSIGDGVVTNRWLVEIQGSPRIKGGSSDKVKKAQDKAIAAAKADGARLTVNRSYSSTWNGVSVTADLASAKKLARAAGVAGVYPVITVARPQESSTRPNVNTARGMTGADVVNQELGFTGKGSRSASSTPASTTTTPTSGLRRQRPDGRLPRHPGQVRLGLRRGRLQRRQRRPCREHTEARPVAGRLPGTRLARRGHRGRRR